MSQEKMLRAVALGLAAMWPVGLALGLASTGVEGSALVVMAAILLFLPYAGGPIVSVLLSRERGEGTGCAWALMAFFFPIVVLPIIAFKNVRVTRAPRTAHLQATGDLTALNNALHALKPPYLASNAAYALARLGSDQALQVLVTALGDRGPGVRAAAAGGLGLLGPRALEPLLAAARDPDPWVREAVARSAGQIGGPRAETALLALLDDRYPSVRAAAARGLAQAGSPAALAPLAACLEDAVPAVRRRAVEAVARVAARGDSSQGAAIEPALLNRLQDQDPAVRRTAAEMLGVERSDAAAVPLVTPPAEGRPIESLPVTRPEPTGELPGPDIAGPAAAERHGSRAADAHPAPWEAVRAGRETSNLAVASLALGIATWLVLPIIGALAAIVTGHLARRDIRNGEGRLSGSRMALAGLALGYGQMAGLIIVTVVLLIAGLLSLKTQRDVAGPAGAPLATPSDLPVVVPGAPATPAMPTPWYEATAAAQALEMQQVAALQTSEAAQAEAQAGLSMVAGWPIIAQDTFEPATHMWPLTNSRDAVSVITTTIESGRYRLMMDMFQGAHRGIYPSTGTLTDFYLAIDAQQISGPEDSTYGIDFRARDNEAMYYFCIYAGQYYALGRLDGGQWANLIPVTAGPAIQVGGVNRLAILASGPHLTFFINDVVVAAIDDATYDSGTIALGVELNRAGDEGIFEFDNVELRAPAAASLPGMGMKTATPLPPSGTPSVEPAIEILSTAAPSASD